MIIIDLVVISITLGAFWILFKQREELKGSKINFGFYLLVCGLLMVGGFYLFDLLTMLLLPGLIGESKAMAFMRDLHLNYAWVVIPLGIASIFAGFLIILKQVFLLIEKMKRSQHEVASALGDQVQAEKSLDESQELLKKVVDNTTAVIYIKDTKGRYLLINRQFEKLFNVTSDQIISKTDFDFFPKEMAEKFVENDRRVLESGAPMEFDEMVSIKDDFLTYISIKFPIKNYQGEINGVAGISTDITLRKKQEFGQRFSQFTIEQSPDSIFWVDFDGRIQHVNAAACQALGYTLEELKNLTIPDIDLDFQEEFFKKFSQQLKTEKSMYLYGTHKRKDGSKFPIEVRSHYIEFEGREYICAFTRDITERKKLEDQRQIRARQQSVIAELGLFALEGAPIQQLMDKAVEFAVETLDVEYTTVLELLPDGRELLLRAGVGLKGGLVGHFSVSSDRNSQAGFTLLNHDPVIVEDLRTETRFTGSQLLLDHNVRSGLSVIIGKQEKPFGVFGAHTTKLRQFSDEDVNFLQALSNVLAEAIDRKKVERELSFSHFSIENAPAFMVWVNEDAKYQRVNETFLENFGYNRKEILSMAVSDLDPNFLPHVWPEFWERIKKEGKLQIETQIKKKNNHIVPVEILIHFISFEGKDYACCFGFEITERKKTQEELEQHRHHLEDLVKERTLKIQETFKALKESQRILSTLMSNLPGMAYRCKNDRDRTMEFISDGCEDLTGYKSSDLENNRRLSYNDLIHPDDQERIWEEVQQGLKQYVPFKLTFRIVAANGTVKWIWEQGRGIWSEKGDLEALEGLMIDITERINAENETLIAKVNAERANEAKSDFLSQMSHELRTPLNAIIGFSQVLMKNKIEKLTLDQREDVEQIHTSGEHLLILINDILDLSRIESGQMILSMEPVDVIHVTKEVLNLTKPLADQFGIKIIDEIAETKDLFVWADPFRLKQVVLNLVTNAIKYNKKNGTVTLSCENIATTHLRISIIDTGLGISEEHHGSLFEPFYRTHSDDNEVDGVGIGLTISKKIMDVMNGKIDFTSHPNSGSCFNIELPLCSPTADPQDQEKSVLQKDLGEKESNRDFTLLYIEDNSMNLALVKKVLGRERPGIKFLSAPQAKLGLDLARGHRPDLILMDINLPGMDGVQALEYLKTYEETRQIPVIAISADAMPAEIDKAMKTGFQKYLTKPINVDQLLEVIDQYLHKNQNS